MKGGDRACPRLALDVEGRVQDPPRFTSNERTCRCSGGRADVWLTLVVVGWPRSVGRVGRRIQPRGEAAGMPFTPAGD